MCNKGCVLVFLSWTNFGRMDLKSLGFYTLSLLLLCEMSHISCNESLAGCGSYWWYRVTFNHGTWGEMELSKRELLRSLRRKHKRGCCSSNGNWQTRRAICLQVRGSPRKGFYTDLALLFWLTQLLWLLCLRWCKVFGFFITLTNDLCLLCVFTDFLSCSSCVQLYSIIQKQLATEMLTTVFAV